MKLALKLVYFTYSPLTNIARVKITLLIEIVKCGHESQFPLTLVLTAAAGMPGSEGKPGWPPHCLERG